MTDKEEKMNENASDSIGRAMDQVDMAQFVNDPHLGYIYREVSDMLATAQRRLNEIGTA